MITQAIVREFLRYDSRTGIFTRRRGSGTARIGDVAGHLDGAGYIRICILGERYRAHQLAWLYVTGKWPRGEIDHRNRVKRDNRWSNLRDASRSLNVQNRMAPMSTNRSGYLGVMRNGKRFTARIKVNYRVTRLGTFDTAAEAHRAYMAAKRRLHAEALEVPT